MNPATLAVGLGTLPDQPGDRMTWPDLPMSRPIMDIHMANQMARNSAISRWYSQFDDQAFQP